MNNTPNQISKSNQFCQINAEQLKADYGNKLLTSDGYLYYLVKSHRSPGWEWLVNPKEFCATWGISKTAFYRSIERLQNNSLLSIRKGKNGGVVLCLPDNLSKENSPNIGTSNILPGKDCPNSGKTNILSLDDCPNSGNLNISPLENSPNIGNNSNLYSSKIPEVGTDFPNSGNSFPKSGNFQGWENAESTSNGNSFSVQSQTPTDIYLTDSTNSTNNIKRSRELSIDTQQTEEPILESFAVSAVPLDAPQQEAIPQEEPILESFAVDVTPLDATSQESELDKDVEYESASGGISLTDDALNEYLASLKPSNDVEDPQIESIALEPKIEPTITINENGLPSWLTEGETKIILEVEEMVDNSYELIAVPKTDEDRDAIFLALPIEEKTALIDKLSEIMSEADDIESLEFKNFYRQIMRSFKKELEECGIKIKCIFKTLVQVSDKLSRSAGVNKLLEVPEIVKDRLQTA